MYKLLALLLLMIPATLRAQTSPVLNIQNNALNTIGKIEANPAIPADSAFSLLSNWSGYPEIKKTGTDYLYYYNDAFYGKVPVRVYIPASYKQTQKNTCVLLLHGAVGGSSFADIDTIKKFDDDILFASLKKQNYIIIRPVADPKKNFDWVVNHFGIRGLNSSNPTYKTLIGVIAKLKEILNIDDNKVFAMGHSDGSDGTLGLAVFTPNQFAGFIAYNSLVSNIFARNFYIRNALNFPLYIVHSDLDKLRPIKTTRRVVDSLKQLGGNIIYKEYIGYEHYDKHLNKDLPFVPLFIAATSRNIFKTDLIWETDGKDVEYEGCNWLKVTHIDASLIIANWHLPFDFPYRDYNERRKEYFNTAIYSTLNPSGAVKTSYLNNVFTIQTSRVTEAEIMISPVMVNLEEPVTIIANGKEVFKGKVKADKKFIVDQFKNNFDRDALWVTSIKVKID